MAFGDRNGNLGDGIEGKDKSMGGACGYDIQCIILVACAYRDIEPKIMEVDHIQSIASRFNVVMVER
jgi:hypothetical protein